MFIKYGKKEHLESLLNKGEMFFNPAIKFREIEKVQKNRGQGDRNDGGLHSKASTIIMTDPHGRTIEAHNIENSVFMSAANETPVFCLKRTEEEYISEEYREELRNQFPDYTHALIIEDEKEFLECVRYSMHSKAFAHDVFYEDNVYTLDYIDFLKSGNSEMQFYPMKAKKKYYAHTIATDTDNRHVRDFFIDDSNFYKTMFRKDTFFQEQSEFRIVLPREKIVEGRAYHVTPKFCGRIVLIDDMIKKEKLDSMQPESSVITAREVKD